MKLCSALLLSLVVSCASANLRQVIDNREPGVERYSAVHIALAEAYVERWATDKKAAMDSVHLKFRSDRLRLGDALATARETVDREIQNGFERAKAFALQNGLLLHQRRLNGNVALYIITRSEPGLLSVEPMIDQVPQHLTSIVSIGGNLYVASTQPPAGGLHRIGAGNLDVILRTLRSELLSPKDMNTLAVGFVDQSIERMHSDCGFETFTEAYQALISGAQRAVHSVNQEYKQNRYWDEDLRRLRDSLINQEEFQTCPFLLTATLQSGLNPHGILAGETIWAQMSLAYSGEVIGLGKTDSAGLSLPAAMREHWSLLRNKPASDVHKFLARMAESDSAWENATEYIDYLLQVGTHDTRLFLAGSLHRLGIVTDASVRVIATERIDVDGFVRARVETSDASTTNRPDVAKTFVVEFRAGTELRPPLQAYMHGVPACDEPLLYDGQWWRICPVEESSKDKKD